LRDPLLGTLNYALYFLFRVLPLDWGSAIGGALGRANGRTRFPAQRLRALVGFHRLGGLDRAEAEAAADRLFTETGRVMAEFSALHRLWRGGRLATAGADALLAARAAGRPVIVMGLHVSNWEVIGPALAGLGLGFKFIYQPPQNRFELRIAVAARERYGAILLAPGVGAALTARRWLVDERGVLLIYADDERRNIVHAPLFGRPVDKRANLRVVARLAAASGAVVIGAYAERLDGARFRVNFRPPIELSGSVDEDIRRLDELITPTVLARLDQWYMLLDFGGPIDTVTVPGRTSPCSDSAREDADDAQRAADRDRA
jgi:KDO2-lipid IV(A) lauroyltransferase